jgi:hypothetical protein
MANTYATVYKTAAAWTAANPTLKGDATAGQEGVESDTGKRKMGPGSSTLPVAQTSPSQTVAPGRVARRPDCRTSAAHR